MYKKNNLSRFDESGRTQEAGQSSGGTELKVSSPAEQHSKSFLQAREDYVKEMSKEMMMSMNVSETPKGVFFSNLIMGVPLLTYTGFLMVMAPMAAQGVYVDQAQFAYMVRSAMRLLTLNISFFGGIHYGFGACNWEIAIEEKDRKLARNQMLLSFLPAVAAITSSSVLLFASPL